MNIKRFIAGIALLIALIVPAIAQDASQVLRLSVTFRTAKNSARLSPEKRKEVEALEAQARSASNDGKFGDALRSYHHAIALIRNQDWTPSRALGTALQFKSDRAVVDPGDTARLNLSQSFTLLEPVNGKLNGSLAIGRIRNNQPEAISEIKPVKDVPADLSGKPLELDARVPDLPDGNYTFILTLTSSTGEPIVKTAGVRIARGVVKNSNEIAERVKAITPQLKSRNKADLIRALASVEYAAQMVELANKGEIPVERTAFGEELSAAAARLDQIAKGENPLNTVRGDFRWAYVSDVDKTLQPYRVYVPSAYDGKKKYPLIIALHGMGGDENSFFLGYENGLIKREAEARGYIVACPKGRGSASMYIANAERDVIDVIAEMKRDYSIDPDRVYLTGHSMGGYGTWSVAVNHPDLFAAIAPFAGGGSLLTVNKLAAISHVPEIVVHGDADPTVPVEESRKMVKAAEAAGAKVKYIEVPGGNHSNIVVLHMKDVFDWFDTHTRQARAKGAKAANAN
jgi:predicted esterase